MKRFIASLWISFFVAALPAMFAGTNSTPQKGDKPLKVSHGQRVELASYMVPGKTMIFDFTSEFCGPCRAIAPHLDKLHTDRADIAVVKVDINRPDVKGIDWRSPIAQQFGLRSIPHFKVFGPDGTLVAEGDEAWKMVIGWIER